jgi:hypothetical protein
MGKRRIGKERVSRMTLRPFPHRNSFSSGCSPLRRNTPPTGFRCFLTEFMTEFMTLGQLFARVYTGRRVG